MHADPVRFGGDVRRSPPPEPECRPAILAVDGEPAVLVAVARDLRRGFGERYRILRATSGAEALGLLRQMRTRGDQVALRDPPQEQPFPVEIGSGTGLGLATARRIVVDRHNGSLSVQSAPGRTSFLVRLPLP